MIYQAAITHQAVQVSSYSNEELASVVFRNLGNGILPQTLILDLCNGNWKKQFGGQERSPEESKIVKAILEHTTSEKSSGRDVPSDEEGWLSEARAFAQEAHEKLDGIISSPLAKKQHVKDDLIVDLVKCPGKFEAPKISGSIGCKEQAYIDLLRLSICNAFYIDIIDPFLNPNDKKYEWFLHIFPLLKTNPNAPIVRIHSSDTRQNRDGKNKLIKWWQAGKLRWAGAYIKNRLLLIDWPEIHDRYFLCNFGGVHFSRGFPELPNAKNAWNIINKADWLTQSVEFQTYGPHLKETI